MYFLAIVLPPHLNDEVLVFKHFMQSRYGCCVALRSPAHITIIPPFWFDETKETVLVNDVSEISSNTSAFSIRTNNFSCFKPRTIFIDVNSNSQLDALKKKTETFLGKQQHYKLKIDERPAHFHITIATRDLHKKAFHEAYAHFANQAFIKEWMAEGLSVLKHNKTNWEVLHSGLFTKRFE